MGDFWLGTAASLLLLTLSMIAKDNPKSGMTAGPPRAQAQPVVDYLQGREIVDPYRWLEDASSPATQEYVQQEMAYTRRLLDPLPGREKIRRRLQELLSIGNITAPQPGGSYYFYTKRTGSQNQPILYVREGVESEDRVVVDANQLAGDGTVALDWWTPTHDGTFVAYGTSASGSEMSTLQVIETATGKLLPDTIERTRAASIAWKLDNSGFYYTRYPKKGEVPQGQEAYSRHVFYHALGSDPSKDPLIFGAGRDPEDWPDVTLSNDGRWLLIAVGQGWSKSELFLLDVQAGAAPVRITEGKNFLYTGDVYNGRVYVLTNEDAPRYRVLAADAAHPARANWKEIIPQSDAVLQESRIVGGRLLTCYQKNVVSQLRLFDLQGEPLGEIPLPSIGTVAELRGTWDGEEMFFGFQSFTVPPAIYRVGLTASGPRTQADGREAKLTAFQSPALWAKVDAASVDSSHYEVNQVWYKSKDGTRVPMFLVYRRGLLRSGSNPTLLTGYGGFNINLTPSFSRNAYVWLEHGGIYAVANLRGGAEFGEDWHRAGMLDKKQNVFDDFIAAAEYLIAEKYTDADHLAIQGGSNGGLLVGVAVTQRPELYRAAVCQVPLLDMLRYQNFQIAKLWIPEYGSAENPTQFEWLYAYSPYHHVKAGVEYPAVLFVTADTDTRVDPMHARKMAALMQAEARNGRSRERPILLRIETKAGHGAGKPVSKMIEEFSDIYSFLFWQLGIRPKEAVENHRD
jgi:prolyl oligopeptidase